MSGFEQVKTDYKRSATEYHGYGALPLGQLESQLIQIALGDCTGYRILDLGGGTGVHARQAIDAGAAAIDIVDISPHMLQVAEQVEESLGRKVARFFEADVSKSLSHLPLRDGGYDLVMANWVFDHVDSREVLEGMFRNVGDYLKPGGRFVSLHHTGRRDVERDKKLKKYGISIPWVEDIPGGIKYQCVLHCTPPIELDGAILDILSSGSTELHEKFGLTNVERVPFESAEVVQKNPDFWQVFVENPMCVFVTAVKEG